LRISVNLSARQFVHNDLVESIAQALDEAQLAPEHLEIELTESLVMADVERAIGVLRELKALGVQLSIDDFGTGYSSLSYLKRFPIDVLKIDRSFVNDITTDTDDAAIVSTIISLAHSLRLQVIAEGVETEAQLAYLRQHDCDQMQGYFFSPPVSAEAFARMQEEGKRLPIPRTGSLI
jgi:EAL domain-containing protein (putative c-di-GMP-specific phosphodiesterase class I)